MFKQFGKNVVTTSGFFIVRLGVAFIVAFAYLFVAAAIQYAFVELLGESTFNYIVGGALSLFLGVIVCNTFGNLLFMFVRGWHVSALAYASKIRKSHAPAVLVGMNAFRKNLVGFGAVYGIKILMKNLFSGFKDKLWTLLDDIPVVQPLKGFADNPIVEHIAKDVLNYGFDATIFYLIKNPPEDLNDVPSTVTKGLKIYLYCLPSIMVASITSYVLFRFVPKLLKTVIIFATFFTQGIVAGILITVLMWPVFYILDKSFFDPLTMIMFISCYAKQCNKEIDRNSKTVKMVDSIIDGEDIGTGAEDVGDIEEDAEEEAPKAKPKPKKTPPKSKPKSETPEPEPAATSTTEPEPARSRRPVFADDDDIDSDPYFNYGRAPGDGAPMFPDEIGDFGQGSDMPRPPYGSPWRNRTPGSTPEGDRPFPSSFGGGMPDMSGLNNIFQNRASMFADDDEPTMPSIDEDPNKTPLSGVLGSFDDGEFDD